MPVKFYKFLKAQGISVVHTFSSAEIERIQTENDLLLYLKVRISCGTKGVHCIP